MKKKKFQDPADTLKHVLPDIEELDEARGENRTKIYRETIAYLEDYEVFISGLREIKAYVKKVVRERDEPKFNRHPYGMRGIRKHDPSKGSDEDIE